jgi:hypothetical protein
MSDTTLVTHKGKQQLLSKLTLAAAFFAAVEFAALADTKLARIDLDSSESVRAW